MWEAIKISLALGLLGTLAGCGGTSTAANASANAIPVETSAQTPWFCQVGQTNSDWDCVRDEHHPPPRPLPNRFKQPGPLTQVTPQPPHQQMAVNTAATAGEAVPAVHDEGVEQAVPKHVSLSFKPDEPMAILDLPETYWIVQLVSLTDKAALEAYAAKHGLTGMSAARVWAKEQFFYVLILGVYETYEIAKEASSNLPAPFDQEKPWIRSVGSLQTAMRAADAMAGNAVP